MPVVNCYRCPHCATLFETKEDYRKHVLDTLIECAETINTLYKDAQDLNIGFREVVAQYGFTRYYEAKDLGDEQ